MARVILALALFYLGMSSIQFNSFLLEKMGFQPFWIGVLQSVSGFAAIVSPIFPSLFLRWFGGPARPIMATLLVAALSLALLPHLTSYWAVLADCLVNSFAMSMTGPLITIHSMDQVKDHGEGTYFRVRAAGTAGFFLGCVLCFLLGRDLELTTLYAMFAGGLIVALLLLIPDALAQKRRELAGEAMVYPSPGEAIIHFKEPGTAALLGLLTLVFFAIALSSSIVGNYVVGQWHLGKEAISLVWLLGTFFEIPLMFFCAWILKSHGLVPVLFLGLAGTVLKLVGMTLAPNFFFFCLAFCFHGCFFAGAATAFDVYLQQRHGTPIRAVLQPIVSLVVFSLPGITASLVSGSIWQNAGLWPVLGLAGVLSTGTFLVGLPILWRYRTVYGSSAARGAA